jgi:SAM-dependent methyltransferase
MESSDNRDYWDEHADGYDSLYTSDWCQLEDRRVAADLVDLALPPGPIVVLDIGCGTGFALRQLGVIGVKTKYTGIDISPKMIASFNAGDMLADSIKLQVADFARYAWQEDSRPTLIISTYGSINFSRGRWSALARLSALQRRGDTIFLMVLNRYSLRRVVHLSLRPTDAYRTRSSHSSKQVAVFYDTLRTVKANLTAMGYKILLTHGDGPLSGLYEQQALWPPNDWIGQRSTLLSHTITIAGRKA